MSKRQIQEDICDEDYFDDDDDLYDAAGNVSPGGLYDAGGHPVSHRWAEYADWIRDSRDR